MSTAPHPVHDSYTDVVIRLCDVPMGVEATDIVTGVKGVVMAATGHINGCVQVVLQPRKADSDNQVPSQVAMDAGRLKFGTDEVMPSRIFTPDDFIVGLG